MPQLPDINLPDSIVAPSDNKAYNEVVDYFNNTTDFTQNPCNNFYEYTCNNLHSRSSNLQLINFNVAKTMLDAINTLNLTIPFNRPIKDYFEGCLQIARQAPFSPVIQPFLIEFKRVTNVGFPLFDSQPATQLSPTELATAIGYLSGTQAINTLIDAQVMKNLNGAAYITQLGEPVLTQPVSFYQDPTIRAQMKSPIINSFESVLKGMFESDFNDNYLVSGYRTFRKSTDITDNQISAVAESIYKIESVLASKMQSYTDRNDPNKLENQMTIGQLKSQGDFGFLDWGEFFSRLTSNGPDTIKTKFTNADFKVSLAAPKNIASTFGAINDVNNQITPDDFANYLNFRIIWDVRVSLVKIPDDGSGLLPFIGDQDTFNKYICALGTRDLTYLHSQIYMNHTVGSTPDKVNALRQEVAKIGNGVIGALKSQVLQTTWLSDSIKQAVGDKFDSITLNLLVDNNSLDTAFLTKYYRDYKHPTFVTAPTVLNAFRIFIIVKELTLLDDDRINRDEFLGSSSGLTPIYDALTNSLSIPASLAMKPLFSPDYPLASNYGGLGYLIARELAHSFDKFGIEFDKNGNLNDNFLDANTKKSFDAITSCLINQYNGICPLPDGAYSPNCLDGTQSLNENIADNAGNNRFQILNTRSLFKESMPPTLHILLRPTSTEKILV